jgi:osmotically-inducible protein OsmY
MKIVSDKILSQRVRHALAVAPGVDGKAIGVAVDGAVVTLTGRVSSAAQKAAAERAVKRVPGVRAVAEEIDVIPLSQSNIADDVIAQHALAVLDWDTQIPKNAIQVTVQQGGVTLSGHVESQPQRELVEDHVRKLPGVSWVVNKIAIKSHI